MPIEILELVVKANITENKVRTKVNNPVQEQVNKLFDKQLFMEEIVAQVCAIMEYKNER